MTRFRTLVAVLVAVGLLGALNAKSGWLGDTIGAPARDLARTAERFFDTGPSKIVDGDGPRILVGGDSVMGSIAEPLARRVAARVDGADVEDLVQVGASISTPELFDWTEQVSGNRYDLVMLMSGPSNNGAYGLTGEGLVRLDSDEWRDWAYNTVVGIVDAAGTDVVWLVRPRSLDQRYWSDQDRFFAVLTEVAAANPRLHICDLRNVVGTGYSIDVDGKRVDVRQSDGVHLTDYGGQRYADAAIECLPDRFQVSP